MKMNIKEADLIFLSKEDMTSVYEMEDILDLPAAAYYHFMSCEDEILYVHKAGKCWVYVLLEIWNDFMRKIKRS